MKEQTLLRHIKSVAKKKDKQNRQTMVVAALQFSHLIFNYGRFHNNKVNQEIHFIFIPIIQFTLFILGAIHGHRLQVHLLDGIVPYGIICFETWLLFSIVMIGYFIADWRTALVTASWSGLQLVASQYMAASDLFNTYKIYGNIYELKDIALCLHIIAWVMQLYGHVHEGRTPAFVTNILYSLLAPFFITFECLNDLFGYREEEMKIVRIRIELDIDEYDKRKKKSKSKKRS